MRQVDSTFTLLQNVLSEKYNELGKLNLCHRFSYGSGSVYTMKLKTIQSVSEDGPMLFYFEIQKGTSIPIEFVSETISEGIQRSKQIVEEDEFIEILDTRASRDVIYQQTLRFVMSIIAITIVLLGIAYTILGIISVADNSKFSKILQVSILIF